MKITVLCGGTSTERDVSLTSGSLICKALKEKGIGVMITGNTIKCSSQEFADQIEG